MRMWKGFIVICFQSLCRLVGPHTLADNHHIFQPKRIRATPPSCQDFCAAEYPRGPAWKEGGLSAACFLQGDSGAPSSTRAPAAQPPSAPPAAATTSQPGAAQPAKRAGQVPRAPPPPPPGHLTKPRGGPADEELRKASGPTGVAALFADLNRGTAVTAGLRKVTADMKTKNRPAQEGAGIAAPAKPQAGAVAAPQRAAPTPASQPPRFELVQGQKWAVEHQVGVPDLVVADTEPKHTVYVYGCRNSTIQVCMFGGKGAKLTGCGVANAGSAPATLETEHEHRRPRMKPGLWYYPIPLQT